MSRMLVFLPRLQIHLIALLSILFLPLKQIELRPAQNETFGGDSQRHYRCLRP